LRMLALSQHNALALSFSSLVRPSMVRSMTAGSQKRPTDPVVTRTDRVAKSAIPEWSRAFTSKEDATDEKKAKGMDYKEPQAETVERFGFWLKLMGWNSEGSKGVRNARKLYVLSRDRARDEAFRKHFNLPPGFNTEFVLQALHVWMLFARMRRDGKSTKQLKQDIWEHLWEDKEKQLYELGVGVLWLNRRVRELQDAFYGMAVSMDLTLATSDAALFASVYRNVFMSEGRAVDAARMVAYVRKQLHALEEMDSEAFMTGQWDFVDPPQ